MSSDKVLLLIGGSGMIGTAVKRIFADAYEVISPTSKDLNIYETSKSLQIIQKIKPDVIIYALSLELKEDTDDHLLKAYHVDIRFPLRLISLLKNSDSRLITFSTDMVFPENTYSAYIETDKTIISSPYIMIKIGMESLLSVDTHCIIVRLSRIFGPSYSSKSTPVTELVNSWLNGQELHLITDVEKSYTYSVDVARMLLHVLQKKIPQRLYHIANTEKTSMFGFFSKMSEYLPGKGHLVPVTCADLNLEKKPKTTLLASQYLPPMRPWHEAVQEYCRDYF